MTLPSADEIKAMDERELRAFALGVVAGAVQVRGVATSAESFTLPQAAKILQVSRSETLAPAVKLGLIPTIDVRGRKRIARETIDRILREGWPMEKPKVRGGGGRPAKAQTKEELAAAVRALR